jgi:3-oxoadipate CoA-transferase beta subunit
MDLAIGAKQTFVMMNLLSRDGAAKLVPECTYPLTGLACVTRVYTDLAVFLIEPGRVVVRDVFGIDFDRLTTLVGVHLVDGTSR